MIAQLKLTSFIFLLIFVRTALAVEMSDEAIKNGFEIIKEPSCKKAKIKEPPIPKNSIWYERNYVSVDGGGICQIHQIAVFWMSESFADNRKYTETTLYRYEDGGWVEEFGLYYIPNFRLRNKLNRKIYLVVDKDFGDFQVKQIAYYTGGWKKVWSHPGKFGIQTLWGKCLPFPECSEERVAVEKAIKLLTAKKE